MNPELLGVPDLKGGGPQIPFYIIILYPNFVTDRHITDLSFSFIF